MDFINIIASTQSIFLILMLLRFGPKDSTNNTLIFLLTAITISLSSDNLLETEIFKECPQLSILLLPWDLTIGPLLLFYFQKVLQSNKLTKWQVFHIMPALVLILIGALLAVLVPSDVWQEIYSEDLNMAKKFEPTLLVAQIHVGFYLILCVREWLTYQDCTHSFFSSTDGIELNWLRRMLWIFGVMWTVWLSTNLLAELLPTQSYLEFGFPVGVYLLAYNSMIYRNIILPVQTTLMATAREQQENTKKIAYQRARLSTARRETLQKSLADTMKRDLPFLDPTLNLPTLAAAVGASSHELSQLLNDVLNENFYDYINRQRTQEVQRCLRDPAYDGQSILDIAIQSGFNSKAAFNAVFKRLTGVTPSQYRKNKLVQL